MKLRNTNVYFGMALSALVLTTACKDEAKEAEAMKVETERVEKEAAEKKAIAKMEMEKKAEEDMKLVAKENSIAYKTKETVDLSTLNTAIEAAELNMMLSEPGSYTIFAPSNHAFSKLPEGTVENLVKPENKAKLTELLQYHVVPGVINSEKLAAAIKGANGKYSFKTVKGEELTAMMNGDQFVIMDASGKKAQVIQGNVEASNGIVYVIDTVLMASK